MSFDPVSCDSFLHHGPIMIVQWFLINRKQCTCGPTLMTERAYLLTSVTVKSNSGSNSDSCMQVVSSRHQCWTIGPRHRQKLNLSSAKAQTIWDLCNEIT